MEKVYDTVIGLEVHVQLNTVSKAFSSDQNLFGSSPNQNIHPVSMALPGALPCVNKSMVSKAVKLGLALNSKINTKSSFDRKHYFYPDSPKGYQITQDSNPILIGGELTFPTQGEKKSIRIHHVHMEDDAGKSIHDLHESHSMIDLNRSGTPLLEVVTEPDFSSGQEVADFLSYFQILLRYIAISDANMEEGSLRCDCNVSVKKEDVKKLGTRCEIKNINSKKFAKTAIEYESRRQIKMLEKGESITQETRLFDSKNGQTFSMRKKEDALDYRYFPDPDLPSIAISEDEISKAKSEIDFLPWTAYEALVSRGVSAQSAHELTTDKNHAIYFITLNHYLSQPKLVADFIINQIIPRWPEMAQMNHHEAMDAWVSLLTLVHKKKISPSASYPILIPLIIDNPHLDVVEEAEKQNLILVESSEAEVISFCRAILDAHPNKVAAYKKGKLGLIGFFMGQAKRTSTSYSPQILQETFKKELSEE